MQYVKRCLLKMVVYVTIVIITFIAISNALESTLDDKEADVKSVMEKFFKKLLDVDSKYVVDQGLSKTIKSYFNGKVNAFPLFKINVKIDRTPVRIPWTLDQAQPTNEKPMKKKYKYLKHKIN